MTIPIPPKPNQRRHLPSLNPQQLKLAHERIDALKIHPAAKAQVKAMMSAAANPNSERPDVILRSLARERQTNAQQLQQEIGATFTEATQRGGQALMQMDQTEWDRLVEEANANHPTE